MRPVTGTGRRLVALAVPVLLLSGLVILTIAPPARAHALGAKLPSISIDDAKVKEGDSGSRKLVFTVTLSRPSSVRVHYRTYGDTATKKDFKVVHGTLRFTRSIASRQITVKVIGDALHEPDERLSLHLTNPRRARIVDGVGRGTILDDDVLGGASPVFSIGDFTVTEGNVGTTDAVFDVTVSSSASTPMSVNFGTVNGSAASGSDYNPAGGTLVFAPGETAKQVAVQVNGDTTVEPDEKFSVNLSNASGATIADAVGLGTITDDDSGGTTNPSLSIANATVTEGNSGTVNAVFTVTLSAPSTNTVTVSYATAPGSAVAPADYTSASGTLTFNPGETSQQIIVLVQGDTVNEANETFSVNLSGATNATIADNSGLGTITDNDTSSITIGASTVTEGNVGTVNAVFNVTLSAPSGSAVTVDYATANGSATAAADYIADNGTVTFNPGEVSKQIVVLVAGDLVIEPNETYSVNLSDPTNATIAGAGFGLGTITDDDTRTISIGNNTFTEVDAGLTNVTFTVTLSASSGNTITVNYATADGSATAPGDYVSVSGTLTFNPGETTKQVIVQIAGDFVNEPNETYSVNLSNATNATIAGSGIGLGTITNDDP
ncbi:MAG: Calx-beta domain-containing protein [Actinomycetota bacterium]